MSGHSTIERSPIYGIMAEYSNAEALVEAATKAKAYGYRVMDAYSAYPIEELEEPLDIKDNRISLFVLLAGLCGATFGFGFLSWVNTVSYPLNIGGRPLISAPMFIPITFECTVLAAGLTSAIGMLLLNGLPLPYHPVFNVPGFERASQDGFFLCIEATDPMFNREETGRFLENTGAEEVSEVAH
jgi:ActD protein